MAALFFSYGAAAAPLQFGDDIEIDVPVRSWSELRDRDMVKQQLDTSCGAASLATILSSFYGETVSERNVLAKLFVDDNAASFADLANAAHALGYQAQGLALSFADLRKLRVPVIAYIVTERGDDHFTVVRGIAADGSVRLGDPSWGNRVYSQRRFLQLWNTRDHPERTGKILLIVPQGRALDVAVERAFFAPPKDITRIAVELLPLWHHDTALGP